MKRERKFYLKIILAVYFIWLIFFEAVGQYASVLPTRDFTTHIGRQIPLGEIVIDKFRNIFTGGTVQKVEQDEKRELLLGEIFANFPVAMLEKV